MTASFVREVQQWSVTNGTQDTAFTIAHAVSQGDTLIIPWGNETDNVNVLASVTDSKGNSYSVLTPSNDADNSYISCGIAYGYMTAALTTSDTITFHWTNTSTTVKYGTIFEFSGIQASSPIDAQNTGVGAGITFSVPLTTTNAADVLVGIVLSQGPYAYAYTVGGGFTDQSNQAPSGGGRSDYCWRIISSTGTYNSAGTFASFLYYRGAFAAFKAVSAIIVTASGGAASGAGGTASTAGTITASGGAASGAGGTATFTQVGGAVTVTASGGAATGAGGTAVYTHQGAPLNLTASGGTATAGGGTMQLAAITIIASAGTALAGGGIALYQPRPPVISIREMTPLRLHASITIDSGRQYRWGLDEPLPENVMSGLTFSSTMPGGYENCACVLARQANRDYDDLEEFATLTILGIGGQIASQTRLEQIPRASGDRMAISPAAVGWQAHLTDNQNARGIYVDRDQSKWQGPSVGRQLQWLQIGSVQASGPQVTPDVATGMPALMARLTGSWTQAQIVEGWYDAHSLGIGSLYVSWRTNGQFALTGGSAFGAGIFLSTEDSGVNYDQINPLSGDSGSQTLTATTKRPWAILQFWNDTVPGGQDSVNYDVLWTVTAVYGDHNLTKYGTDSSSDARGLLASDIIKHAVQTWAPRLAVMVGGESTITASSWIVPHLSFTDPTTCAEIVKQAARFDLWDWAVWDGPSFWYYPRGSRGTTWRVRVGPSGLSETGPQADRIYNGVVVLYKDVSGINRMVGPPGSGVNTETTVLVDSDPQNPANLVGLQRWASLSMGVSTEAAAIQIGYAFLTEQKLLVTSGEASLVGHVEDSHGNLLPAWSVKAGDYIEFMDAADPSPRRIVKAEYTDDTKTCRVSLDSPPEGLAALLERLNVTLGATGIS